ncbi:malate:quinone oxidoreductase [Parafilimonas terrae]|uniref:Probable malate:quinone oxidoreductase n=1 Tax=Parafilimonas terrae TaxID=1465490 RepID=A0A1I5YP39_9BACT|nr:malate:quinone oxidoreductase [Parafilimonas terrae]SFQ45912.1 malate dehydrogenase (quinone) [Parafilimonas terrae]
MQKVSKTDVLLIGAGIMSATLGMLLKLLDNSLRIKIVERLNSAAAESSDAWNNAGTGHSAFCELNYTPEKADGSIDISKAVKIAESFETSKQFWSYLVTNNIVEKPQDFIRSIPHVSFVWGDNNVNYLRKRYMALQQNSLFEGMQFSEDDAEIAKWVPLVMRDRDTNNEAVAATKMNLGTDVNFGALTRCMFNRLLKFDDVQVHYGREVEDIEKHDDYWHVKVKDEETSDNSFIVARFVFIGAGGGSLPLLLKSGIPEAEGYGGFPVSGQWLRCTDEAVIQQHHAKVYGLAKVGSPPMSVPHLDTRWIKGKQELLFGPFAGFTTKFLRHGSAFDLFKSVKTDNIKPMVIAGLHNIPLTKYLIEQVMQSPEDRLEALKEYYPDAKLNEWELVVAGYRVQVIKKDEKEGGILEFGTEVVSAADRSIAALLGASPGASTAVSIMLDLLARCFPEKLKQDSWQQKLKEMIPSYGKSLKNDSALLARVRKNTTGVLGLEL